MIGCTCLHFGRVCVKVCPELFTNFLLLVLIRRLLMRKGKIWLQQQV